MQGVLKVNNMNMYNVVVYDGVNAWVSKFVLKEKTAKRDIAKYFSNTDGKVVELDKLYEVNLKSVISYKMSGEDEYVEIAERFLKMYD